MFLPLFTFYISFNIVNAHVIWPKITNSSGFDQNVVILPDTYLIELMCEAQGNGAKIVWMKDSKVLSNVPGEIEIINTYKSESTVISEFKYIVRRASEATSVTYRCLTQDYSDHEWDKKAVYYQEPQIYLDVLQEDLQKKKQNFKAIMRSLSCKIDDTFVELDRMTWYFNNEVICYNTKSCNKTEKYELYHNIRPDRKGLKIKNTTIYDSGEYKLEIECQKKLLFRKYVLIVEGPPRVQIKKPVFCNSRNTCTAICEVIGLNTTVELTLRNSSGTCINHGDKVLGKHSYMNYTLNFTCYDDDINVTVTCSAMNTEGNESDSAMVHFIDEEKFLVKGITVAARGYPFNLSCIACATHYDNVLMWYEEDTNNPISGNNAERWSHSFRSVLSPKPVTRNANVTYICKATANKSPELRYHTIIIKDPVSIRIIESNLTNNYSEWIPNIKLYCKAEGLPLPSIEWRKDGITIESSNDKRFKIVTEEYSETIKSSLSLSDTRETDYGNYSCFVTNLSKIYYEKYIYYNIPSSLKQKYITITVFGVVVIFFVVTVSIYVRNYLRRPVKLPLLYSESLHFPRERLNTGADIGRGQFGVVKKGEAIGILGDDKQTVKVAVKMTHLGASKSDIGLLKAELDILVRIGHHHNIVNMLKASMDLQGSEVSLLIIFDFYQHGSVYDYLLKHKNYSFDSGKISDKAQDVSMSSEKDSHERHYPCPVTTCDLHYWSYQIAKGMEFVSSKNIIHRDLAARNILLADKNVVKIGDFGLAKDISNTSGYKESSDIPLPVAWMSIEAHKNEEVTIASDVWSFGVLMWELYSFAETPYKELILKEKIRDYLCKSSSNRLHRPKYADDDIYRLMLTCWREDPKDRPSFQQLGETLKPHLSTDHLTEYMEHSKDA